MNTFIDVHNEYDPSVQTQPWLTGDAALWFIIALILAILLLIVLIYKDKKK